MNFSSPCLTKKKLTYLQELIWIRLDFVIVITPSFRPLPPINHHPLDPLLLLPLLMPHFKV